MAGAPGPGGGLCMPSGGQTTPGGHTGAALAAPIFIIAPVAKTALIAIAKSMGVLVIFFSLGYEVSIHLHNASRCTRFPQVSAAPPSPGQSPLSLNILWKP